MSVKHLTGQKVAEAEARLSITLKTMLDELQLFGLSVLDAPHIDIFTS